MKLAVALSGILIAFQLVSCQQEPDWNPNNNPNNPNNPGNNPGTASGSFEAKVDGQLTTFKVIGATLLRSTSTNEKRVDITGESLDGTKQLTLTFGEMNATGNSIPVKDYVVRLFNDDDPNTPQDESQDSDDGFITYATKIGSSWVTDVYAENGVMKVTACDATTKKISGTFNVKDSSLTSGPVINFTEGKFTNVGYMVVN
jgi:hypothetical protein